MKRETQIPSLVSLMYAQLWYLANSAKQAERSLARYSASKESIKADRRKEYLANPEKFKKKTAAYAKNHIQSARQWRAKWKKAHPEQVVADAAMRRAVRRNAFPKWADRKQIKSVYAKAQEISQVTGIPHHVDHTYPLVHKLFTGLHVSWNLQVIPAHENYTKNNRVTPGMLAMSFPL